MFNAIFLAVFVSFGLGLVAGVAAGWFTRPHAIRVPDPQGGMPASNAVEEGTKPVVTEGVIDLAARRRAA